MMIPALLSAVLLLLLLPAAPADNTNQTPFTIVVMNAVTGSAPMTYSTYVLQGGILLGGMRRLQDAGKGFSFTYTEYPDYGPYLVSVNGLAETSHTFWKLLVQKPSGTVITLNVGIGCYTPAANDKVILMYTRTKPLEITMQ